ncbi:class I SAM-dependent methyltransferase [Bacteroidota bacterium]
MKYLISYIIRNVPRKYLQLFSHIIAKGLSVFYIGRNVECPVCGSNYRKFLPYGRKSPRSNALCPNCLSLERHRLMWLYLKEKTDFLTKKLKVLHIAPELCFINRFEAMGNLDYVTADLESPLAKVKMDIHDIPFDQNTFNVVFCNHVMEHVNDDIKAMSEIYRVLKPSGWAIIQIPFIGTVPDTTFEDPSITNPKQREKVYGQSDHVRLYGWDYPDRLRKAGFMVKEDNYVKELSAEIVQRHALPQNEVIYFCHK